MSTVTVTLKANGKSESSKSCTTYIAAVFIYRFQSTNEFVRTRFHCNFTGLYLCVFCLDKGGYSKETVTTVAGKIFKVI